VSTSLEKKVQDALNESRILVLGVQVLLSFQYTSVLESAFVKLPFVSQVLELITLALLLLTFGFLVSPVPYPLLVWRSRQRRPANLCIEGREDCAVTVRDRKDVMLRIEAPAVHPCGTNRRCLCRPYSSPRVKWLGQKSLSAS
jgi:hypothetical protein